MFLFLVVVIAVALLFWLTSLKQINQFERGVVYSFGRFTGIMDPGWRFMWPYVQQVTKVDIRTKAVEVPKQEAITKDNVQAKVTAVIYYKVVDPAKAINEVENYYYAVSQLAQTSMRNVIGSTTLNQLLAEKSHIAEQIQKDIDRISTSWGVDVQAVELKDIELPESMIRTMAKQAEAEREQKATIIASEGEVIAAENLAKAAQMMSASPGALHLRTLNSINDISSDQSNTVVFVTPIEILRAIDGFTKTIQK
ncbi:slipin family protein [Candidatus Woesebacteria bacterium]|nr:slipin family protein [Candidatus Woesebacteria bacterium]